MKLGRPARVHDSDRVSEIGMDRIDMKGDWIYGVGGFEVQLAWWSLS